MSEEEGLLCDNCKLKIAPQNHVMHTLHCTRHLELCNKCGEPVPKGKLDEHYSAEHASENCRDCGQSVEKAALEKHLKNNCPKRLIPCLYCELELPSNEMTAHTEYCGTRTERCKECGEFVMLKYTQLHLDSNHKFLKLEDEPGPSASWEESKSSTSAAEIAIVENGDVTLLPCEFCDGMFTPRELRRHQVSCTHGWSSTIPILRKMAIVRCDICRKSVASQDYEAHRIVCDQLKNTPSQSAMTNINTIPCDVCDKAVPFEEYKLHYTNCSKNPSTMVSNSKRLLSQLRKQSVIICDICNESISSEDYQRHSIFCTQPITSILSNTARLSSVNNSAPKLPCEFCDESFSPDRLAAHQICCSPIGHQTLIPCEVCGELKSLAEVSKHQITCQVSRDY